MIPIYRNDKSEFYGTPFSVIYGIRLCKNIFSLQPFL